MSFSNQVQSGPYPSACAQFLHRAYELHISKLKDPVKTLLQKEMGNHPLFVRGETILKWSNDLNVPKQDLYWALARNAIEMANPQISNSHVGNITIGKSGNAYFGFNFEFSNLSYGLVSHGEQTSFANARLHQEEGVKAIYLHGPPCGHCRQFMAESKGWENIEIHFIKNEFYTMRNLGELLADKYGRFNSDLFSRHNPRLVMSHQDSDELKVLALDAAKDSYSNKDLYSGVVLLMDDGRTFQGSMIEVSGSNPSLPPSHSALIQVIAHGYDFSRMEKVILAEIEGAKMSWDHLTKGLVESHMPQASYELLPLKLLEKR